MDKDLNLNRRTMPGAEPTPKEAGQQLGNILRKTEAGETLYGIPAMSLPQAREHAEKLRARAEEQKVNLIGNERPQPCKESNQVTTGTGEKSAEPDVIRGTMNLRLLETETAGAWRAVREVFAAETPELSWLKKKLQLLAASAIAASRELEEKEYREKADHAPLSEEHRKSIWKEVHQTPLNTLRDVLLNHPLAVTAKPGAQIEFLKALLSRIETTEQTLTATRNSMISETEHSRILSKVNTLELQIIRLEAERNTLVEVVRIQASGGRINPVEEGRPAERVPRADAGCPESQA